MLRTYVLCLILILTFYACDTGGTSASDCLPDDATVSWSTRSNFKLNFEDKHSDIKVLKPGQKRLLETLLNQVKSGELKAFQYLDLQLMKAEQIGQLFEKIDTVTVLDPDSGDYIEKIIRTELNKEAVRKARVKEEWYYDETKRKMYSRVIGLAPMETIYNSDGTERGDTPLFWVFFDEVPID